MGTRAITVVYCDSIPLVNLYRQYDCYPHRGHGQELADFLKGLQLTNGLSLGDNTGWANGMGCLAAQLVAHFKQEAGQFYLYPTDDVDCGQDYEYHVYANDEQEICVRVVDRGCNFWGLQTDDKNASLFDGTVKDFDKFCSKANETEEA